LEAAESITGLDPLEPFEILDLLEQLHNKSLISAREGELDIRYALLETVRQYAQLKLAQSGEADQIRDRHLSHFLENMEQGKEAILSLRGAGWQELMVADNDNFRVARDRALENDTRLALRFVANLTPHWNIIFPAAEALKYIENCLARAESSSDFIGLGAAAEDMKLLAAVHASGAFLALFMGLPSTIDYALRGAAIAREQNAQTSLAVALLSATARSSNSGEFEAAKAYFRELQMILPGVDSEWVKALFFSGMALVFSASSEEEVLQARKEWETGMAMFRQSGEIWGLAFGHQMAARVFHSRDDFTQAEFHARRSLELYTDFGEIHSINMPRSMLADLSRERGDYDQAEPLFKEAVLGWRNVDQLGAVARCLELLAFVSLARVQDAGDDDHPQYLSRSVTLLGAADVVRQIRNTPMSVTEKTEYEEKLTQIKALAGETLFSEAWQQGQKMDLDQAVTFASE